MRKLAMLLAALALPAAAQVPLPAAPTRYVTDGAGVLDDTREHALNERLAQYERETSNQLIVYVDRTVPDGTTLEEMGAEAIRTWAVGQAKKDNGAILFLFIDDRESRIEVGYGLEGTLTDARSKRILVELRPALRDGDYTGAVEQGVETIIRTIADPDVTAPLVEAEAVAAVPESAPASPVVRDVGVFFVWVFFGLVVIILLTALRKMGGFDTASSSSSSDDSWSSSDSSSSFSSSDSSSSSSSDFSGGGGSGGGGGASDKW